MYSEEYLDQISKVIRRMDLSSNNLYRGITENSRWYICQGLSEVEAKMSALSKAYTQMKEENERLRTNYDICNRTIERLENLQAKQIKSPAYKAKLLDRDIRTEYEKTKSFCAVGKALGCDHKTVKNRLIKMGYTF